MDILLKNVPDDIRKFIVREQAKEKENRGTQQYSLSMTIVKLIRELKECKKSHDDGK